MTSKPQTSEGGSETQNAADEKAKKEELVEAKMRMIRKKNEEVMRRQKEIEEDRKNADLYSEMAARKNPENFPSGVNKDGSSHQWGKGRGLMLQKLRKETMKAKQWEAKRRENVKKEEEQRKQTSSASSSASRFLADDNRVDMSRTTGRNEHSWGGASFSKVVSRVQREKDFHRSDRCRGNNEVRMSGKERHEYNRWREERVKIDEERKARQKKAGSRAWDQPKVWDPRKKMWAYENDIDDHSFRGARRHPENSEDWGVEYRSRRRDYQSQGTGEQGPRYGSGFQHRKDGEVGTGEQWGDTTESKVAPYREEEWGESSMAQKEEDWIEDGKGRVLEPKEEGGKISEKGSMLQGKHWEQTMKNSETVDVNAQRHKAEWGASDECRVLPPDEAESTADEGSALHQLQHHDSVSNPQLGEMDRDFSLTENKENNNVTEVASESAFDDAPKPRRELKQRRKQTDSEGNDVNTNTEPECVTESQVFLDKGDLPETVAEKQDSTRTIGKDQGKHLETTAVSQPENEFINDEGVRENQSVTTEKSTCRCEQSKETVHVEDIAGGSIPASDKERSHEDEGLLTCRSVTLKAASLPKLVSKVDKKVAFDSEKSEGAKESDSQEDASSATIGDIPPTPDFLKYDHNLPWGDIEVNEEDSDIAPKW